MRAVVDPDSICPCGHQMNFDPSDDAWVCLNCIGLVDPPWLRPDPISASKVRQMLRTRNGEVEPASRKLYEAVVAAGPCVYCGEPATVADHVRPLSRGGTDDAGNLVPACRGCNGSKWAHLLTEWDTKRVAHARLRSVVVMVEYARLTGTAAPVLIAAG
jgi:hypothetical protein